MRCTWLALFSLLLSPAASAQTVSMPNTLANGSVADADAMNENFAVVVSGLNTALANRAMDRVSGGGMWDGLESKCLPRYDCFVGGYCSQAAIDFPPVSLRIRTRTKGTPRAQGSHLQLDATPAWEPSGGLQEHRSWVPTECVVSLA